MFTSVALHVAFSSSQSFYAFMIDAMFPLVVSRTLPLPSSRLLLLFFFLSFWQGPVKRRLRFFFFFLQSKGEKGRRDKKKKRKERCKDEEASTSVIISMGGVPSRDAYPTFFSLRYGSHEIALIPLLRRYFCNENKELRKQFVRMRNDPSVRYNFMRSPKYSMKELPPASYTEKDLDTFIDVIEETLYDSLKEMVEDEDTPLRPVPCAVCFVYVNGREGTDCFLFYGRRINVIGQFGCHRYEDKKDDEPCLYLQKAILKAAGDRTLERVVTLASMALKEEFFRAVTTVNREANAKEMFLRRISRLPLVSSTFWNSYPVLKFLYDTAAWSWSVGNVQEHNDAPSFRLYEVPESGESGLVMEMPGSLLLRFIFWACSSINPSAVRGMWEQYGMDDTATHKKEKMIANWLETSPDVNMFVGGVEFTLRVKKHLETLLSEVVRARETPTEDLSVWSAEQECSHDGKIYRIFDSPLCGPFLTTVKVKRDKKNGATSGAEGNRSNQTLDPLLNIAEEPKKRDDIPPVSRLRVGGASQPHATRPPPEYEEAVNSMMPSPFLPSGPSTICPVSLPATVLPHGNVSITAPQNSSVMMLPQSLNPASSSFSLPASSASVGPTFIPLYSEPPKPAPLPMQSFGIPYVVLTPSGPAVPQQNIVPLNSGAGTTTTTTSPNLTTMESSKNDGVIGNAGNITTENGATSTLFSPIPSTPFVPTGATFTGVLNGPMGLQSRSVQPIGNYVLLPDGNIGVLNSVPVTPINYWNT
ncbi:hypothetical protein TCDM_00994 [Trypanosoma cruzi Dm28c]|uniref:Uncharacterized protein n=1 Tax=Trypanosoma cruzi Dm28c TaxID=1416333 RepID=V5BQT2_TRYCR|nr:hypothetical protein TCDM_00994 [Trypanosoma cruzi Dm28c]